MVDSDRQASFHALRKILPVHIPDTFIEEYISNSEILNVKKNEVLVPCGTLARTVYFIVHGSFLRSVLTPDNDERMTMFQTDSFFSFMVCTDSFLEDERSEYFIRANEDSLVLKTGKDFIRDILDRDVDFLKFYADYVGKIYLVTEKIRNRRLSLNSADYLRWLYANFPFLFKLYPSKSIAGFMGITPVWFSKIKRRIIS